MTQDLILTPTDFIAIANNALEIALGYSVIEGELSNFRVSKNKWVYFDLKDDYSKVSCFGSVYNLPGPLEDGMLVRVAGQPRLHPQFGFSLTVQSIMPTGEGSLNKAFELLKANLIKEGLFDESRKRSLIYPPTTISLITSIESAAYADFTKILQARWPFVKVVIYDVLVQGENSPSQLVKAINNANSNNDGSEALVITRGGGSADDLASFNDERVVRAIAASRIPTLVAIGHETDISLAEMAADLRASTPSNAAELLVPDRASELANISNLKKYLTEQARSLCGLELAKLKQYKTQLLNHLKEVIALNNNDIKRYTSLLNAYNPELILKRGYSLIELNGKVITSSKDIHLNDEIIIKLANGSLGASVNKVNKE